MNNELTIRHASVNTVFVRSLRGLISYKLSTVSFRSLRHFFFLFDIVYLFHLYGKIKYVNVSDQSYS